jgi:hypothetical protein
MFCCPKCFQSNEIKAIIDDISTTTGVCDYCKSSDIKIIDAREIVEPFQPLLEIYEISSAGGSLLCDILQSEWKIFNLPANKINVLLSDMFSEEKSLDKSIFSKLVVNKTHNHRISKLRIIQWTALKTEIIEKNRFFLSTVIDLDQLKTYLIDKEIIHKKGQKFFRGRISTERGLSKSEIGKPPKDKATAGRANPKGIPYLYLSTEKETTLYETRATFLGYITIGTFQLKEDIRIVKLRAVEITNPFEEKLYEKLLYQPFLKKLENDLAQPLRRFDSELDYLPTQYICEYIKFIGFDGVEYGSAMKKGGVNIAIFEDSKFECVNLEVVEIKRIEISV